MRRGCHRRCETGYPRPMTGHLFKNVLRPVRGTFFLVLLLPILAAAEPFRPQNDKDIIEELPPSPVRSLSDKELDPSLAAQLAKAFIERNQKSGDSRLLGYAQGVLSPWWESDDAPDEVLMMRAILKQSHHQFDAALVDLEKLIARKPDHAQAWLSKASVLRVQGKLSEAAAACERLDSKSTTLIHQICSLSMRGMRGELDAALDGFEKIKSKVLRQPANIIAWYYAERAEAEARAGRRKQARKSYEYATRRFPDDVNLRAAYADLLLDNRSYGEVIALIPVGTRVDALKLRQALAAMSLGDPAFKEMDRQMRAGFKAMHARGEALHIREEARYRLAAGDPIEKIIPLAQKNWAIQHEPWDARILIDSANRAGDSRLAKPVKVWLKQTGMKDARLPPVARP